MKNKILSSFIILTAFLLSGCADMSRFFGNGELYVSQKPTITSFNVGQAFDSSGLKIINLDNHNEVTDYSLSPSDGYVFTESDVGDKEIAVTHPTYKSTSFTVEVTNLRQLEISSYPKVDYQVGEAFDIDGLVITCNEEIVTGYHLTINDGYVFNEAGTYSNVVSKQGYGSTRFDIHVAPLKSLVIAQEPDVTTYDQGDTFSSTGLVVTDESSNVITDYTLSINDGDLLKYAGTIKVQVSKVDYQSASFDITVNEASSGTYTYKDLTFYYLNDTHGSFIRQIDGSSYEAGMSYIGKYIKDKVALNPDNSIVLSGGDMFQGGYESNLTRGNYMIDAMNIIGFDAMALGNHEFDWDENAIVNFADRLNCPILSCNTFYSENGLRPDWVSPYTILEKGDVKIGVIGVAEEGMGSHISGSISDSFLFDNPIEYIKDYSNELRLTHNCDIVVAVFHDGGFEGYEGSPTKFEELTLNSTAGEFKYVDAMFFAHDHLRKQGSLNDVPYLEAACNGKNIGELTLNVKGDGVSYIVESSSTNVISAYNTCETSDSQIDALANKEEYRDIVSHADDIVYNFKNSYSSSEFAYVVAQAMYWYVNEHPSSFDNIHVYFSNLNTGGVRASVSSGDFTNRNFIKVFPFDNWLSMQTCTSKNISYMTNSSYYTKYQPTEIVYDGNGHTHSISINFITEQRSYASRIQVNYVNYPITAREALLAYLLSGVDPNL